MKRTHAKRWGAVLGFAALLLTSAATVAFAEEHAGERTDEAVEQGAHGEEVEGAEHHGIKPMTLALQLFNFGVLVFILVKFGGGAVNKALQQRHDQLKSDLEESARLRTAAEARLREYETRMRNLEAELATMIANLKREAEGEKLRLIAGAEERVRRIQDETRFLLDQQVKDAELRFRAEIAAAAAQVAEELLKRSVTADDQRRLAATFIGDVETTPSSAAPALPQKAVG